MNFGSANRALRRDTKVEAISTFLFNQAFKSCLDCSACKSLPTRAMSMKLQFRWVLYVDFAVLTFCCFCSSGSCAIARDSTTVNLANFPQERKVSSGGEDTSVSLSGNSLVFQGQEQQSTGDKQAQQHREKSKETDYKVILLLLLCSLFFYFVYSSALYVRISTCRAVL